MKNFILINKFTFFSCITPGHQKKRPLRGNHPISVCEQYDFGKQKFDVKQLKMNKFIADVKQLNTKKIISDVKQLKMKKFIKSIWKLIFNTSNATLKVASLRSCSPFQFGQEENILEHSFKRISLGTHLKEELPDLFQKLS